MTSTVAIIPARGGSKGLPRKNLIHVGGIALVARAIEAAHAAARIDMVVVSTDDEEIAATAREWGADVVRRPAELSGDTATSESAVLHALRSIDADGVDVGIVVLLQATSPFIDARTLDEGVDLVAGGGYDSVFSAVETYGFLWRVDEHGTAVGLNHDSAHRPRRQDREPHHLETGAFYVMDAAGFQSAGHRFFGRIGIVPVAERTAIEIDDGEQVALARAIAPLFRPSTADIDVSAIVTDFDGVHTDDTALVDADGGEQVRVSRTDGMGVSLLRRAGIPVLILSTETHPVVGARARKLRVEVRQGIEDKASVLREWAGAQGIPLARVAYLGNDVNDLPCLQIVGWPVAVADAHPLVRAEARIVLTRGGGDGAVRELADAVLQSRSHRPIAAPAQNQRSAP